MNKRPKSFHYGNDNECIETLLEIHCLEKDPKILDCTYNTGKMWKNSKRTITKMDINSNLPDIDIIGDFTNIPLNDNAFDVIIFDPPHLPSVDNVEKNWMWNKEYSSLIVDGKEYNIKSIFIPFLLEAKRVLKKNGIILAKISDMVKNHKYQWQHVDLINAANTLEITPCDLMIKVAPTGGNLQSNKWKNIKHLRNSHCYWIVIRNSKKCEA